MKKSRFTESQIVAILITPKTYSSARLGLCQLRNCDSYKFAVTKIVLDVTVERIGKRCRFADIQPSQSAPNAYERGRDVPEFRRACCGVRI